MSGPRIPRCAAARQAARASAEDIAAHANNLHVVSGGHLSYKHCQRMAYEEAMNEGMFALEHKHPWVWWAYATVLVATCALSAVFPWGVAQ